MTVGRSTGVLDRDLELAVARLHEERLDPKLLHLERLDDRVEERKSFIERTGRRVVGSIDGPPGGSPSPMRSSRVNSASNAASAGDPAREPLDRSLERRAAQNLHGSSSWETNDPVTAAYPPGDGAESLGIGDEPDLADRSQSTLDLGRPRRRAGRAPHRRSRPPPRASGRDRCGWPRIGPGPRRTRLARSESPGPRGRRSRVDRVRAGTKSPGRDRATIPSVEPLPELPHVDPRRPPRPARRPPSPTIRPSNLRSSSSSRARGVPEQRRSHAGFDPPPRSRFRRGSSTPRRRRPGRSGALENIPGTEALSDADLMVLYAASVHFRRTSSVPPRLCEVGRPIVGLRTATRVPVPGRSSASRIPRRLAAGGARPAMDHAPATSTKAGRSLTSVTPGYASGDARRRPVRRLLVALSRRGRWRHLPESATDWRRNGDQGAHRTTTGSRTNPVTWAMEWDERPAEESSTLGHP